jgi:hypothetical protein
MASGAELAALGPKPFELAHPKSGIEVLLTRHGLLEAFVSFTDAQPAFQTFPSFRRVATCRCCVMRAGTRATVDPQPRERSCKYAAPARP